MESTILTMLNEILDILKRTSRDRSADISIIMQALAKAQGAYKPLIATEESSRGKYANLQSILTSTREALSVHELAFYQFIELLDDGTGASLLKTVLGHSSGQFISSTARILASNTHRETGRMLEFHKRMHAMLLLGIAPSHNDPIFIDDDGEEQATKNLIEDALKPKDKKITEKIETISNHEYNQLMFELHDMESVAKDIMKTYDIQTIADLPKSEYYKIRAHVRRIKEATDEYNNRKL